MCSKWHPQRWRHTCIRHAKLSMTRTHFSLGISLIFAVIAAFSSPIVWGLFSYTLSLRFIHIILEIPLQIKIWGGGGGFKSGECAAHSISHFLLISLSLNRSLSQARESFVVCGVAPSLPEPLFILIYTSASSQWCPKLHQYRHIAHSPDLNPPDFYL